MKKILVLLGLAIVLYSPGLANAQELTRADVETLKPQLLNLVSSLSTVTTHISARIATENALFGQYSNILGALSLRLGSAPAPTDVELASLSGTLTEMQRLTNQSVSWRASVKSKVSSIVQILGNISSTIASAA